MKNKGILTVVSGFSGAGKGTTMKELMKNYSDTYALSISAQPEPQDRVKLMDGNTFLLAQRSLKI